MVHFFLKKTLFYLTEGGVRRPGPRVCPVHVRAVPIRSCCRTQGCQLSPEPGTKIVLFRH